MKCVFKLQDLQMFSLKLNKFENVWSQIKKNVINFHPLEVVGRGSETQLQVGENL